MSKATGSGDAVSTAKAKSQVFSPSSNPAEALKNAGGMPPIKTEDGKSGIFETNMPKKAPDSVRGI